MRVIIDDILHRGVTHVDYTVFFYTHGMATEVSPLLHIHSCGQSRPNF